MKVYIGPYKNFYGPYQLVDMLFFWQEKYPEGKENRWDYKLSNKLGNWLADTWVAGACEKIHDWRGPRKIKVKLHKYDSWNLDDTLALIILPLLKQLKATKQGSGYIDMEDVPEYMRTTRTPEYDCQEVFEFYKLPYDEEEKLKYNIHDRYEWVLDEMIWAFEQLQPDVDWEDQYWIALPEIDFDDYTEDEGKVTTPLRWKVKGECDWVSYQKHQERISNGLRLFDKYFSTLWN